MDINFKRVAWFGLSTLILGGLLYFANFDRVVALLQTVKLRYFLPAAVFGFSTFLVFGFTWHRFFRIVGHGMDYRKSLRIYLGGEFLNSITPVGQFGGEPFMAYVIRENTDMKYEEALSTVLSADIINTVPIITFVLGGFIYLLVFGSIGSMLARAAFLVFLAVVVGGGITYLLWFRAKLVEKKVVGFFYRIAERLDRGRRYVDKLEERMEGVRETFQTIGAEKSFLISTAIIAHSFFILSLISLYFVLRSLSVTPEPALLIFVIAFSGISSFMPTPGGSGAYEATMAGVLTFFLQIDIATATAAAILFRVSSYWPIIVVGYASLVSLRGGKQ